VCTPTSTLKISLSLLIEKRISDFSGLNEDPDPTPISISEKTGTGFTKNPLPRNGQPHRDPNPNPATVLTLNITVFNKVSLFRNARLRTDPDLNAAMDPKSVSSDSTLNGTVIIKDSLFRNARLHTDPDPTAVTDPKIISTEINRGFFFRQGRLNTVPGPNQGADPKSISNENKNDSFFIKTDLSNAIKARTDPDVYPAIEPKCIITETKKVFFFRNGCHYKDPGPDPGTDPQGISSISNKTNNKSSFRTAYFFDVFKVHADPEPGTDPQSISNKANIKLSFRNAYSFDVFQIHTDPDTDLVRDPKRISTGTKKDFFSVTSALIRVRTRARIQRISVTKLTVTPLSEMRFFFKVPTTSPWNLPLNLDDSNNKTKSYVLLETFLGKKLADARSINKIFTRLFTCEPTNTSFITYFNHIRTYHRMMEESSEAKGKEESPPTIIFADQNFVSTLSGGKSCLAIVRLEDASIPELGELAHEILDRLNPPAGTLFMFGSASHLLNVGTTIYTQEWCSLVDRMSNRYPDARIIPLAPVIMEDCPGMVSKQLIELTTWYKNVYNNNILGLTTVWDTLIFS
jgi:hypothetical protein